MVCRSDRTLDRLDLAAQQLSVPRRPSRSTTSRRARSTTSAPWPPRPSGRTAPTGCSSTSARVPRRRSRRRTRSCSSSPTGRAARSATDVACRTEGQDRQHCGVRRRAHGRDAREDRLDPHGLVDPGFAGRHVEPRCRRFSTMINARERRGAPRSRPPRAWRPP